MFQQDVSTQSLTGLSLSLLECFSFSLFCLVVMIFLLLGFVLFLPPTTGFSSFLPLRAGNFTSFSGGPTSYHSTLARHGWSRPLEKGFRTGFAPLSTGSHCSLGLFQQLIWFWKGKQPTLLGWGPNFFSLGPEPILSGPLPRCYNGHQTQPTF